MKSPCTKECKKRTIGCHSKCEAYIKFRKYKDKENELKSLLRSAVVDSGRIRGGCISRTLYNKGDKVWQKSCLKNF